MALVKDAIKSLDNTEGKFEETVEAVRALEALGTAKAEIFVRDIQQNLQTAGEEKSNQSVPVTFIVGSTKVIRAFASSQMGSIEKVVTGALTAFLSGDKQNIINGIGRLITSAMSVFLGEGEASDDTIEMYYVATDGLSPVRVDVKAWYQCVQAKSITSKIERIVTVVATKSIIDVSRIDLGTFLYLYQGQFDVNTMSQEELSSAIAAAASVYNKFVEYSVRTRTIRQQRANTPDTDKELYMNSLGKVRKVKDIVTVFTDNRPKE